MTIQSMDQLISALTAGSSSRFDWNKNILPTTVEAVGQWYDRSMCPGNPMVNSILGSNANLAHTPVSDATGTVASTTALNGNIATTVFTDTTHGSNRFTVGMILSGSGITAGTQIISLGTGTGANNGGTYNLNFSQTVTSQTIWGIASGSGMPHGGNVSPAVKVLSNASAFSAAATTAPMVYMLYDMLACYTISSVTTTGPQNFTGQAPWPRYANGAGVRAFLVPSIVMGAGTPTVQLSYTNQNGVAGQLTPSAQSLPVINTTAPMGSIPYSGTGLGKYGPFLPMAPGDSGIQSVQSINFSATMTTGCMVLVICRPLALIPVTTVGVAGERDFINMLPSMPTIFDGACLNWMCYAGAANPVNSSLYGHIDTVWG